MRDFAKFACSFWTSPAIQALSDRGKLLAAYLISGPHSNMAAVYRLPSGYVEGDLGWKPPEVESAFEELRLKGFATVCAHTNWVVVHKALKHNRPENPAQCKHVETLIYQLPAEATIRATVSQALTEHWPKAPPALIKWLRDPLTRVTRPSREPHETLDGPSPDTPRTSSAGEKKRKIKENVREGEARASRAQPAGEKTAGQPPSRRKAKATATPLPEGFTISDSVRTWATKKGWAPYLDAHLEFFIDYAKARPAEVRYDDWDCAFRNCIRCDWGRIREALMKGGVKAVLPADTSCTYRMGSVQCGMPGKPRGGGILRCDHHELQHQQDTRPGANAKSIHADVQSVVNKMRMPPP